MSMPGQAAGTEPSPGTTRAHRPAGWHTRLLRLLTGQARVPRDARLVILAAMAQTIATSGFSTYVGIWAIEGLHASAAALGVALLLRAGSGVLTGPVGGRWSDTHGRRPVIVGSWLAQAACIGAFAVVGRSVAIGLTLVVLFGPLGPPGRAATAAYIADVTSPGERPVAYSALRSAQALAQITGPAAAAVLAGGSRWPIMFGTFAVISFAAACGAALLPRRRDSGRPGRTAAAAARTGSPWRDFPYVAFLIAATVITLTMAATDRFLPIAAVGSYHVPTRAWGLIALLNPVLVVALQTRLTRRTEWVPPSARLAAAAALTGLPFLLLLPFSGVGVVVTVVVIATFGEMLWLPLAQALASDLAPPDRYGAYLGAFDGATSVAYAFGPTLALEVRAAAGSAAVWAMFAGLAAVGAVIAIRAYKALAARVRRAEPDADPVRTQAEADPARN